MEKRHTLRLTIGERFECLYSPSRAFRSIHSTKNSHDRLPFLNGAKSTGTVGYQFCIGCAYDIWGSGMIIRPVPRGCEEKNRYHRPLMVRRFAAEGEEPLW
jgi:hypothetical protein